MGIDNMEWVLFGILILGCIYSLLAKEKSMSRPLVNIGKYKLTLRYSRGASLFNLIFAIIMVMGYLFLEKYYELFLLYVLSILGRFFRFEKLGSSTIK